MSHLPMASTIVGTAQVRRPVFGRRGSTSRGSTSSLSDDEDAITPCPPQSVAPGPFQQQYHHQEPQNRNAPATTTAPRRRSNQSVTETESEIDDIDAGTLWRRMLAIQRVFGCYNSARMRAALDLGLEDGLIRMAPFLSPGGI